MSTIKTIIIDDEVKNCEALKSMLLTYFSHIEVNATCKTTPDALKVIETYKPDLVFLNVNLQSESGSDLLNCRHKLPFEVIFTAPGAEFALRALKLSALDYLINPIHIGDLREAIAKAERRQQQKIQPGKVAEKNTQLQENERIALPTIDGYNFVRISDILYFQASGNYTELFLINGSKILVSRQLKEYENSLTGMSFFRIHHSYLVNLKYIQSYVKKDGGYVVMCNNAVLDISRRKKDAFLDRMLQGC
jgi:two-component system LytT family response regulator